MKQLMKSSAMVGLTTLSSLMAAGTASADTQDLALHEKGDDVKMEAWRTDVARVEAENAQAEADAKNAVVTTSGSTTTTTSDDSEKREAMEERNRVLRNEYHEKYRDYMDAVNEGRTDVPEPAKPVYETMLPASKASKTTTTDFTIVRWDEKTLPNGPQLDFYKEAGDVESKPVVPAETKPKGEALAEAPTPENALTLSEGLTSASDSKEVAGDVPTPDNALTNTKEQKSKEAIGEAPTPEKAEGADTHLDKKEDQTSKDTKAPTKTSSGDSINTAKMDKNKLVKVRWVDASGKDLKAAESAAPANLPTHGDIDGYNYVTARQDDKAGEVLYVFAKKSGDEVKTSSKEAEQQAPAKQEAKQTQPAQQAPSASTQPAQTPSTNTPTPAQPAQTSAPQAKPAQAQASAQQATKTTELPTTGDAGSILGALSVLPAALAGLALRKKRED
jgi:LPXTG-motif cell wall anchor domain protein